MMFEKERLRCRVRELEEENTRLKRELRAQRWTLRQWDNLFAYDGRAQEGEQAHEGE